MFCNFEHSFTFKITKRRMKAFFILFSTLSTLFLPVMLMGQSVVEKKRANGLVKTRYSIQGKDTLLSEHFYQNGQLSARIWRDDSVHLFNIGEIGRLAKAYKLKKEVDWIQDHYHGNNWDALTRDSTVEYYPDGKMQRRYFWTGDTLFQEQWFATNGQILEVRWWSKKDSMVNRYIGQDPSQWLYSTNRKRDFHQSIQYQNHKLYKKYSYVQNKLAEELFFDTLTGNPIFFRKQDSLGFHPDKEVVQCLYGFRDGADNWIIPPKYESVQNFNQMYFIVQEKGKYGLLNHLGDLVIPIEWDFLMDLNRPMVWGKQSMTQIGEQERSLYATAYLRCKKGNQYGVIDNHGKIVLKPAYQDVRSKKGDLYEVQIGKKWGIVDAKGAVLVAPQYSGVLFTKYDDLFLSIVDDTITRLEGDNIFALTKREPFLELDYIMEKNDTNEAYPIKSYTKYGLVHRNGQTLLNPSFSAIRMTKQTDSCFWVRSSHSGQLGLFHGTRGWQVDTQAHLSLDIHHYLVTQNHAKRTNPLYGLIALPSTKMLLPFEYQLVKPFDKKIYDNQLPQTAVQHAYKKHLFFLCQKQGKWGIYDLEKQDWAIPIKYDDLRMLSDSVFLAAADGQWRFINLQERALIPDVFESAGMVGAANPYWVLHQDYFVQKGTSISFYTDLSFPFTISLIEPENRQHSILSSTTFSGKNVIYTTQGQVLSISEDTLLMAAGGYFMLQDRKSKKYQLIDNQGIKKQFTSKYLPLSLQSRSKTIIVKDTIHHQMGVLDFDGKLVLSCNYFGVTPCDTQGVIWAKKDLPTQQWDRNKKGWEKTFMETDKNWQMFDSTGKLLSILYFDYPFAWANHLGIGQVAGKQGLWTKHGHPIIPPRYDKIWYDPLSKMFHLFQSQKDGKYKVGFASADGQIVIDAVLNNMSYFTDSDALVETQTGAYGIMRKNGTYWVEPVPNALQKAPFDIVSVLVEKVKKALNASQKNHGYPYDSFKYAFSAPYDNYGNTIQDKIKLYDASKKQQLHNLMLETTMQKYFLDATTIFWRRNGTARFANPTYEAARYEGHEALVHNYTHKVNDFSIHAKGINLFLYLGSETNYSESKYFILNFKLKNNSWTMTPLDSILFLNESNRLALNDLLITQLKMLKNQTIDCSNPARYLEIVENRACILPEGIQFYLPRYTRNDDFKYSVPILLTWDALKPYLKKEGF